MKSIRGQFRLTCGTFLDPAVELLPRPIKEATAPGLIGGANWPLLRAASVATMVGREWYSLDGEVQSVLPYRRRQVEPGLGADSPAAAPRQLGADRFQRCLLEQSIYGRAGRNRRQPAARRAPTGARAERRRYPAGRKDPHGRLPSAAPRWANAPSAPGRRQSAARPAALPSVTRRPKTPSRRPPGWPAAKPSCLGPPPKSTAATPSFFWSAGRWMASR